MATKVEAEGQEIILRNEAGDMAIIPKALGGRIQQLLDVENYTEIDNIVNSLPSSEDYAEDGSLYIGTPLDNTPLDKQTEREDQLRGALNEAVLSKDKDAALQVGKELTNIVTRRNKIQTFNTEITDLRSSLDSLKEAYVFKGDIKARDEYSPVYKQFLDKKKELKTFESNELALGGPIKAQDGLKIEDEPPTKEKSLLESAGEFISEGVSKVTGLFTEDKPKAKTLDPKAEFESPGRIDISNFPTQGLTTPEKLYDFYEQEVSEPGSKEKVKIKDLPADFACTGSACRAVRHRLPEVKNARDLLLDVKGGQGHTAITGTSSTSGIEDPGFDAWELHPVLRQEDLGADLFTFDARNKDDSGNYIKGTADFETNRAKAIANFDPSKITLGTVIGMGSAQEAGYIKKGEKASYYYKGKKKSIDPDTQKSRHTSTVVGFDDESGDALIYDYGNQLRIGTSEQADFTWTEWLEEKNVNYITSLNENAQWSYEGLKQGQKQIEKKKVKG